MKDNVANVCSNVHSISPIIKFLIVRSTKANKINKKNTNRKTKLVKMNNSVSLRFNRLE